MQPDYIVLNRESWNKRTAHHIKSEFYDVPGFLAGKTSLKHPELELLGPVSGKSILHLQCHFGQDTISLGRMGARVTGVDLSDEAIRYAGALAGQCEIPARFICCDLYDLPLHLEERFDLVFTSYGTIGWLPDLQRWADIVSRYLKPGGVFLFVEFHPVVWMFDDDFSKLGYDYFNTGPIVEQESGTYADRNAPIQGEYVGWNHHMGEVVQSLLDQGLQLELLKEYDHAPYNVFRNSLEYEPGRFRIAHLPHLIPMVYAIRATKKS